MFQSRLQVAQVFLALSAILTLLCIGSFAFGPIVVAIFFLVTAHATAATGCYITAETKGYPPLIGIPIGVAFGVMGAVILAVLPDQTEISIFEQERQFGEEGMKNARRRDKGYEVLDDEDE